MDLPDSGLHQIAWKPTTLRIGISQKAAILHLSVVQMLSGNVVPRNTVLTAKNGILLEMLQLIQHH